ncbi:MAG TPA: peptidase, partial [Candidatus Nitrosotenuis sp.]|nr:peptidase [Candidatus Nitrosotenuis sp.]
MNRLVLLSGILLLVPLCAYADSHPNLIVSAEKPEFGSHFSGSMVVEVIVSDPAISDTSVGKGEPDVTINGNNLRMVQATDGRWYGYFANVDKAKAADQVSFDGGVQGKGLDFGVFCSKDTTSLGPTFSETSGIAVPRSMTGSTNGNSAFATCTGTPTGANLNNVVRSPRSINTN